MSDKKKICVCGGGNAAHAFIPLFAEMGYETMVYADFSDEAERLSKAMEANGGIKCTSAPHGKDLFGKPSKISKDPAEIIPYCDVVWIALPSFAYTGIFNSIKEHLKPGTFIFSLPGQGGVDFLARKLLKDEIANGKAILAGVLPMPLNCRIKEWGKEVHLQALKDNYQVATVPGKHAQEATDLFCDLLQKKATPIGNYIGMNLSGANPGIHPARLYSLWKDFKADTIYPENPLFYETFDQESGDLVEEVSKEARAVWKAICDKYPHAGNPSDVKDMHTYICDAYEGSIDDTSTYATIFNTNHGFKGFGCPMKELGDKGSGQWVPDFKNRYFTEDIPESFTIYKGIAVLAGVETPKIDMIMKWATGWMEIDILGEDCKLTGSYVPKTKAPQAFGITTLEELVGQ